MSIAERIFPGFIRRLKPLQALQMKIKAELEVTRAFSRLDTPPILVYQMGKVGSSTVHKSLMCSALPNPLLHLHFLSKDLSKHRETHKKAGIYPPPYHIYLGESVRKALDRSPNWPCKIISLLRDPIAFVVSDLFENPHFARESLKADENAIDPEKALKYLDWELCKPNTFNYVNEWFDRELKQVFDIDVFAEPFPVDVGYAVYCKARVEALVIRLEDLSQKGPKAISEFLRLDEPLILEQSNVRNDSKGAKAYQHVLNKICLSPSLCGKIYSSRFVKHFYDETMVKQFISKWTQNRFDYDSITRIESE